MAVFSEKVESRPAGDDTDLRLKFSLYCETRHSDESLMERLGEVPNFIDKLILFFSQYCRHLNWIKYA